MTRFIELSHHIEEGMETYRGLPVPKVEVVVDYETSRPRYDGKAEFLIASLHLCGNTGTYIDSPRHRDAAGDDLARLPLERLADLAVEVVDARKLGRAIGPEALSGRDLRGKALLLWTAFDRDWRTDAYFRTSARCRRTDGSTPCRSHGSAARPSPCART